jgi:hypothetical protein
MLRKILLASVVIITIAGCTNPGDYRLPAPEDKNVIEEPKTPVGTTEVTAKPVDIPLPEIVDMDVPWGSQAPTGSWGLPYQEACEEATLIGTYYYFSQKSLNEQTMDGEIKKLVEWETKKFGTYTDNTLAEVKTMAEEYFQLNAEISDDVSVGNIKKQLALGKIVITPTAGRLLGSPYYSGLGPIYHMLIIRGYNSKYFITNDVGTRTKGEAYKFKYDVIINAIHDLPLKADGTPFRLYDEPVPDAEKAAKMQTGAKRILILTK